MGDLIDRDALLAAYDAAHKGPPGGARKLIAEAPEVDAVPVRHGRWVHIENEYYDDFFRCSECGLIRIIKDGRAYCERCGAKMDGGEKDG